MPRSRSSTIRRTTSCVSWPRACAPRLAAAKSSLLRKTKRSSRNWRARRQQGGYGLDGLWNDDFHHTACVAVTGRSEAYYTDYAGAPQELISAAKYGYLFQGQRYKWQSKRRGAPAWGLEPWRFVTYIENHDQVANSARGQRLNRVTSPSRMRALTAFLLLGPGTPMLFQGQEFAASKPFHFFADHQDPLRGLVHEGRIQFLAQFPGLAQPEMRHCHLDPGDRRTFEQCKLDFSERRNPRRDLSPAQRPAPLAARRRRIQRAARASMAPCSAAEAFVLRFFGEERRRPLAAGEFRPRPASRCRA